MLYQDTWILRERNKKGKSIGRGKILIKFQTIRRNFIKCGALTVTKIKKEQEREEADNYFEGMFLQKCLNFLQDLNTF